MKAVARFIKKYSGQNPNGMRNRKTWLILKAVLIILFTLVIFLMPVENTFRKWLRFTMLVVFVISFIIDLNNYRKREQ